jgi:hypothetical protein
MCMQIMATQQPKTKPRGNASQTMVTLLGATNRLSRCRSTRVGGFFLPLNYKYVREKDNGRN